MKLTRRFILLTSLLLVCNYGFSQSTDNLYNVKFPYSYFGLGEIDNGNSGIYSGLGSAGVALTAPGYVNTYNPASIGSLITKEVVVDFSAGGTSSSYTYNGTNANGFDFNLRRFQLTMKPMNFWGLGFGIKPYSKVSYNLPITYPISGTSYNYTVYNQGSGNLTQAFLSTAFNFWKISVGGEAGYIFGNLQHNEMIYSSLVTTEPLYANTSHYMNGFRFIGGLHYKDKIGKHIDLELGGTLSSKVNFNHTDSLNVINFDSTYLIQSKLYNNQFAIPLEFRGGLALTYDNQITFVADYARSNWGSLMTNSDKYIFTNTHSFSAGLSYKMFSKKPGRNNVEKLTILGGFNYSKGYISMNGNSLKDISGTAGILWPIRGSRIMLAPSISVGSRTMGSSNSIDETYTRLNFTISLRDLWFRQTRWQ